MTSRAPSRRRRIPIFAVVLTGGSVDGPVQRLKERYSASEEHYEMSQRFHLVRADSISKWVADHLGLSGENTEGPTGVVFRLNDEYSGFNDRSLWEWLDLA